VTVRLNDGIHHPALGASFLQADGLESGSQPGGAGASEGGWGVEGPVGDRAENEALARAALLEAVFEQEGA
jgi:hypothetical protein